MGLAVSVSHSPFRNTPLAFIMCILWQFQLIWVSEQQQRKCFLLFCVWGLLYSPQWEAVGERWRYVGAKLYVCECNGECVSCTTTISSSNARVRETTLAENCCWFGQLVSGSACSKSSRVRGTKGGGTSQQVRAGQRIDQAQQLRQAKQQLTRFIVCLQVPTVSHSFPHHTALTQYFSVFVRKCCCRYSYF